MRRIGEGIREAVPPLPAPMEVRDRLFRSIARARTGGAGRTRGHSRRRLGAAVAAALLLGGVWLGWRAASGPSLRPDALGAIAEDHLRTERSAGLISSDSVEVVRWLRERLPFGVEVPLFPGARLTGARVLLVGGQSGAVVEYAIAGRPLSYYVLPSATEAATEPRRVSVASRAGYRIASWEDAGLAHALVAGLPEPKLVELAHSCIEQMTPATEV